MGLLISSLFSVNLRKGGKPATIVYKPSGATMYLSYYALMEKHEPVRASVDRRADLDENAEI